MLMPKLVGCLPLLVDDLIRAFKYIVGLAYSGSTKASNEGQKISRLNFLSYTALGMAAIPAGAFIYGMIKTAFDYTVRSVSLKLPNLPAEFEGLRIVQISDIHSGSFTNAKPIDKAVSVIMAQKPDVVFFTGDIVNNVADELEPYIENLGKIAAPLGVYSILGNHDYGDYIMWDSLEAKAANLNRLKGMHAQMGWNLLLNQHKMLERNGQKLAIVGVENWGFRLNFPKYGRLKQALEGTDAASVKLLLSHDPSHWEGEVLPNHPDVDAMFAGHTHGFQFGIEIPGLKWSPSQYVYKQWAGLYQEGKQQLYVNRGFGFLGYLGRVGIPPEITVVTLTRG